MSAHEPSGKTKKTTGFRFQDTLDLLADAAPQRRCLGIRQLAAAIERDEVHEGPELQAALRQAANDSELQVRLALAMAFKSSRHLPRDVAVALAEDVLQVAHLILEASPALADEDLIQALGECKGSMQIAIARRPSISCDLARAVIGTRNAAAVTTLAANSGADLDEALLLAILEGYGRYETVKTALVERGDLPASICSRLIVVLPPRLKAVLASRGESFEPLFGTPLETYSNAEECAAAVESCDRASDGELATPTEVLRALCSGDIWFAERAMAEIAGLSEEKASLLIHDEGPFGLKAIYRKCSFPEEMFAAFRVAVDLVNETRESGEVLSSENFERRVVERILTRYHDLEVAELDYVLSRLSRYEAA